MTVGAKKKPFAVTAWSRPSLPRALCVCAALWAAPVAAQTDRQNDFVAANLISIFYHELGHALIDIMQMPVFGQEEDAADVLSIVMINELFEDDTAALIASDAAFGFWLDAAAREDAGEPVAWWGVHGPDLQRYYNLACLFYGADPSGRQSLADELGLPDERAETCEEEYDLAIDSWGAVLDDIESGTYTREIVFETDPRAGDVAAFVEDVIGEEVAYLKGTVRLPETLTVTVEDCGEANAFYAPYYNAIIMCTELVEYLDDVSSGALTD